MRVVCFLLLALSVRADPGNVTVSELRAGPRNVTISELRALNSWTLEARWNVSGAAQTHEVQVARTNRFQVVFQANVSADAPLGTWVWTSSLPLQCADHSVRVRHVYDSTGVGEWSQWATNYGQQNISSNKTRLFPAEEVLQEGSSAHFCCIPTNGSHVTQMLWSHTPYEMMPIDQQVRAIRVTSLNSTKFGVPVSCKNNTGAVKTVLNFVTFPPERPQNLICWTLDLRNIKCSWSVRRRPNLSNPDHRRRYALQIQDSGEAEVRCGEDGCVFAALPNRSFYNVTVVVRNSLGEQSQSYAFNISTRVFPVPEAVSVSAGVWDAELSWVLRGNFTGLHFTCQTLLEPTGQTTELQFVVSDPEHRLSTTLQPLQPSSEYSTRGRCALQGNAWGPWSPTSTFSTEPLVTLDIWTSISHQAHSRSLTVLWRTHSSGSHSGVQAYEVCVEQRSARSTVSVNVTEARVNFTVGFGECNVSVRAVTFRGSSEPSRISVPALQPEAQLMEKRIVGNSEGFNVSWSELSFTTCGYVVDWCMMGDAVPCDLQWRKVSANQTSLHLGAESFRKGCKYTFTIFSCQPEGHRVHEKHIGYLEEQKPQSAPETLRSIDISWSSVVVRWSFNEEDPSHPGFITGYRLTIPSQADSNCSTVFLNISVEDPHRKSALVEGLQSSQRYTVCLAACTQAGCGVPSVYTFATQQNLYLLLAKVVTPLLILIGCCFCLWPCRETLKGIVVDVVSFPSAQSLKVLELNDSLFKVSEMLRVLQVEDCKCCSLDTVAMRSGAEEKARLIFAEGDCGMLVTEELVWDELAAETVTSMTNFTYLSSFPHPPSPALEPSRSHSANYDSFVYTSDYTTSVHTSDYGTSISCSDYATSASTSDYGTSISSSDYATSASTSNYTTSVSTSDYATFGTTSDYTTSVNSSDYGTSINTSDYATFVSTSDYTTSISTRDYGTSVHTSDYATSDNTSDYANVNTSIYNTSNNTSDYAPSNNTSDYAPSNNTSDYAPSNNTSDYAPSNNTSDYAPSNNTSDYAPSNNTSDYAPSDNTRDYAPSDNTRDYVPSNNTRDYAPSNNTSDYVTSIHTSDNTSSISTSDYVTSLSPVTT